MFRTLFPSPEILQDAKNRRLRHEGGVRLRRGSAARAPRSFNEQVTVNSEQVSVGRGVPPSRQHERNTNMNDTTKSKAPRATDARFVARGRRAYWENGRLVRSMDGPCAAPATDETSVVPVSAAARKAAFPVSPPPRWWLSMLRRWGSRPVRLWCGTRNLRMREIPDPRSIVQVRIPVDFCKSSMVKLLREKAKERA